mgnify:CR=1 FL=1
MGHVSNKVLMEIRQELYEHIQKLSFNFFDNPRTNSGYYMFGNIFFTVLEDNYNNFRVKIFKNIKKIYYFSQ